MRQLRSSLPVVGFVVAALLHASAAAAQIPLDEYAERRAALADRIGAGVVIAFAAEGTEGHPFRYLTGLRGGDGVLVMAAEDGRTSEMIFLDARDFQAASWDGETLSPEAASAQLGLQGRDLQDLPAAVSQLFERHGTLHVLAPYDPTATVLSPAAQRLRALLALHPSVQVRNAATEVNTLRQIKSEAELDLIRKAAEITAEAHRDIMRMMRPGLNEFEVAALAEYTFLRYGAEGPSFNHIVASGPNSTVLHYNDNDRFIDEGVLVKMDIGASFEGYAADITRTIPANGRFSADQREIYQIVRDAQAAAEAVARPGAPRAGLSDAANRVLAEGLARVGLIEAPDASYDCATGGGIGECPQLRLFYFHALGHGIGLNVHDPWPSTLEVGSAFTIEPGIYVRPALLETLPETPANRSLIEAIRPAFERFSGIGIRIEDDFLITESGLERISPVPRDIDEIEALMAEPWEGPSPRRDDIVEWSRAGVN
ncbi:MAG: aminopeptidase P family protein [Gemmatimonadota bacterium]